MKVEKTTLRRIHLNQGGYDKHGKYWGGDCPLWEYQLPDTNDRAWYPEHVRAKDRESAKKMICALYPRMTIVFYQ